MKFIRHAELIVERITFGRSSKGNPFYKYSVCTYRCTARTYVRMYQMMHDSWLVSVVTPKVPPCAHVHSPSIPRPARRSLQEVPHLRRELLMATRHILATDLRKCKFLPHFTYVCTYIRYAYTYTYMHTYIRTYCIYVRMYLYCVNTSVVVLVYPLVFVLCVCTFAQSLWVWLNSCLMKKSW